MYVMTVIILFLINPSELNLNFENSRSLWLKAKQLATQV